MTKKNEDAELKSLLDALSKAVSTEEAEAIAAKIENQFVKCERCGGEGMVYDPQHGVPDMLKLIPGRRIICPTCGGRGTEYRP